MKNFLRKLSILALIAAQAPLSAKAGVGPSRMSEHTNPPTSIKSKDSLKEARGYSKLSSAQQAVRAREENRRRQRELDIIAKAMSGNKGHSPHKQARINAAIKAAFSDAHFHK